MCLLMQELQETQARSLVWEDPLEGNDNPFQYSCLESPMDRGAWWATLHGAQRVGHSFTTEYTHISVCIIHFAVYLKTT